MEQRRLPFYRSIVFQMLSVFVTLFLLFAAALGYALFIAEQRERDQAILNTAARLQLVSNMMRQQALNYLSVPARDYGSYFRDVRLYYQDLRAQTDTFDEALGCFASGRFEPPGGPGTATSVYEYDASGHPSVDEATRVWKGFRAGLGEALGGDTSEPRLEFAARFVAENVEGLEESAATLHAAFQDAARQRIETTRRLNRVVIFAAVLLLALTLWWAHRTLRPLRAAVKGFERVAQGDFEHRVPVSTRNEIGQMAEAFNAMTARLRALFSLISKAQEGPDVATTLRGVYEQLARFIALDWIALLLMDESGAAMVIEQAYGPHWKDLASPRSFPIEHSCLAEALDSDKLLRVSDLSLVASEAPANRCECILRDQGFSAALLLPIRSQSGPVGALVIASQRPFAYQLEQEELVRNLAPILSQGLYHVIALQGLLSNHPET